MTSEKHIRMKAWSIRNQELVRLIKKAQDDGDRDTGKMLEDLLTKNIDECKDILRSSIPDEAARTAFDEDVAAGEIELEEKIQKDNAQFEAAIGEYKTTGSKRRLNAYIAGMRDR